MPEPAELKARVLLIDDEPDVLKTVGRRLEQQGYAVLTAPDGFTGLKVARTEHPDVILLDIIMPHLDGHEVLQQLKRDPLTEDIPALMLTAKIAERDMAESIKLGAAVISPNRTNHRNCLKKSSLPSNGTAPSTSDAHNPLKCAHD